MRWSEKSDLCTAVIIEPTPTQQVSGFRTYLIACVSIGLVLKGAANIYEYFKYPVPNQDQLRVISGSLADFEFRKASKRLHVEEDEWVIRINGKNGIYRYPAWMPSASSIESTFSIGDEVELKADVGKTYQIWDIRRNGTSMVDFESTADAYRKHQLLDLLWSATVLIGGLCAGVTLIRNADQHLGRRKNDLPSLQENRQGP